jgi:hypothetical protein
MRSFFAVLAAFALASPTFAAALLNGPAATNQLHHGRQTTVRVDEAGVAHAVPSVEFLLPVAIMDPGKRCPIKRASRTVRASAMWHVPAAV